MSTIVQVTQQGAVLRKRGGQLMLDQGGTELWRRPVASVACLVLWGSAGVSGSARSHLLRHGIPIFTLSLLGQVRGRINPAVPLPGGRLHQYARALDGDFALEVAREIVRGKLENCLRLASQWSRGAGSRPHELTAVRAGRDKAPHARGADELRGHEGAATAAYYRVLGASLHAPFTFAERTRRPPRDPVNILLSLGYTLLEKNVEAALLIAGLDPYLGVFHCQGPGKRALALDLMEEFRPILVDRAVLACLARGQVKADHFHPGANRIEISPEGFDKFLNHYRSRLNQEVQTRDGTRRTWFNCILTQATRLAEAFEKGAGRYQALLLP